MPEVKTLIFSHRELLEILIKSADLHEGEWMLQVSFNFSAANFGPNEDSITPAAIVAIKHIQIGRANKDSPRALVLNAADVNPL